VAPQEKFGKGIGKDHGGKKRDESSRGSIKKGIPVGTEEAFVMKNPVIGLDRKIYRPEAYPVIKNSPCVGKGKGKHIQKRDKTHPQ
jgi:hypothetical protein